MDNRNSQIIEHATLEKREQPNINQIIIFQETTRDVALGLNHLQGAFYLLFMGFGVAILTLLGKKLALSYS